MKSKLVLSRCGFIDEKEIGDSRKRASWNPEGQKKLKWNLFSDRPYDRFGRLDPLSKHVLVAVELLGIEEGSTTPHPDMGIVMGTGYGCISVDLNFLRSIDQPGGASPALFTYTLPSVALGEIAIRHGISGPSTSFLAGAESGLLALWEGIRLIENREASSCICIGAEAVTPQAEELTNLLPFESMGHSFSAHAFLVEEEERAHGMGRHPIARLEIEELEAPGNEEWDSAWEAPARLFDFLTMEPEGEVSRIFFPPPENTYKKQRLTADRER